MASLAPLVPGAINPVPDAASTPLAEPQILLVLAGVVGSGKSTLAHAMSNQLPVRPLLPSSPSTYPDALTPSELVESQPRRPRGSQSLRSDGQALPRAR